MFQDVSPSLSQGQDVSPSFLSLYQSSSIPNCSDLYLLEPGEEYTLLEDGQLHHPGYGHTQLYCVENSVNSTGHLTTIVLKCEEEPEEEVDDSDCLQTNSVFHLFFTILGFISIVFLAITCIVYVSIPKLFNLHGKIVVSNVTSIFLVTTYILIVYNINVTNHLSCVLLGYFGYFASISMFGWMTVICLDLCWTFCVHSPVRPGEGSHISRFLLFSAAAWGTAASLTAGLAAADLMLPADSAIKPNVGLAQCFIQAKGSRRMIFFHIPILVMMMINLILYLTTVYNLYKYSKQTACVRESRR